MPTEDLIPTPTIGILTVATNQYLEYWKELVLSAERAAHENDRITFFVFTDQKNQALEFARSLKMVKIKVFEIENFGWPNATLLRYQIFLNEAKYLTTDILVHLDADMLINLNPWYTYIEALNESNICLIRHPGYWRPQGIKKFLFWVTRPAITYRDFRMFLQYGGLGAWERNSKSTAYVPRKKRRNYYCGGNWFGKTESIVAMMSMLKENIDTDSKRNIISVWHDESHLNYWASRNNHSNLSPEYCFDSSYPQLKGLRETVTAVRKVKATRV